MARSKGNNKMHKGKLPRIILGTMTLGIQTEKEDASEMLHLFLESGASELDTAYVYSEGKAEQILGRIIDGLDRDKFIVATKVQPRVDGNLRPESIKKQLEASLSRLGLDSVNLYYLHEPDLSTPIEITLEAMNKLHQEGKFQELGLSNYPAWQVARIWHICKSEKWLAPSVYQGMYNAITREVERELFPCLRALGIRFYAYNPLAGGLLTGKYTDLSAQPNSWRFRAQQYRDRYWKKEHFEAIRSLETLCKKEGISMTSASLRWMIHHSMIESTQGDGVIIGASRLSQLKENLEGCQEPALPGEIVQAFDSASEIARPVCPKYFRP